mgnify:CR=1 FL=1
MNLTLAEFLYNAYHSPFGIVISTDDAEFLRQKLYAIRKQYPDLQNIAMIISPINGSDLWLVKKGETNAE